MTGVGAGGRSAWLDSNISENIVFTADAVVDADTDADVDDDEGSAAAALFSAELSAPTGSYLPGKIESESESNINIVNLKVLEKAIENHIENTHTYPFENIAIYIINYG